MNPHVPLYLHSSAPFKILYLLMLHNSFWIPFMLSNFIMKIEQSKDSLLHHRSHTSILSKPSNLIFLDDLFHLNLLLQPLRFNVDSFKQHD